MMWQHGELPFLKRFFITYFLLFKSCFQLDSLDDNIVFITEYISDSLYKCHLRLAVLSTFLLSENILMVLSSGVFSIPLIPLLEIILPIVLIFSV